MNITAIATKRLHMRPFAAEDVDPLHRHYTGPQVRKYLWDDIVVSREQIAEVVESSITSFAQHGFGFWAVFLKGKPELIGSCGFRVFGELEEIEILYSLDPALWGQGLATEAAQALLRCGFEEHNFTTIFAGADPPNAASFRVMERLGMKFAKRVWLNNLEAIYYSIERDEFHADESHYFLQRG